MKMFQQAQGVGGTSAQAFPEAIGQPQVAAAAAGVAAVTPHGGGTGGGGGGFGRILVRRGFVKNLQPSVAHHKRCVCAGCGAPQQGALPELSCCGR